MSDAVLHESPPPYRANPGRRFTADTGPAAARARWQYVTTQQRADFMQSMRDRRTTEDMARPSPISDAYKLVLRSLPTSAERVAMLSELVQTIGQLQTIILLGTTLDHLLRMIQPTYRGSRALNKHVWSVWVHFCRPNEPLSAFDYAFTARWTLHSGPQHAGQPRPATIEPRERQRRGRKPAARPGATSN